MLKDVGIDLDGWFVADIHNVHDFHKLQDWCFESIGDNTLWVGDVCCTDSRNIYRSTLLRFKFKNEDDAVWFKLTNA